jgi:PTH1 family peptidyl-tRNA hydrolase
VTQNVQLIVGLGNPGSEYESTRHNAGAFFVNAIARKYGLLLKNEKKCHGAFARKTIGVYEGLFLIPDTYMNNSGLSIAAALQFYKIKPENMLVAHDELDIDVGVARLKQGGGHGGHNGLRDIIEKIGANDFARLRIGIGRPPHAGQVSNFVLSKAPLSEQTLIDQSIDDSVAVLPLLLKGEWATAMLQLHTPKK